MDMDMKLTAMADDAVTWQQAQDMRSPRPISEIVFEPLVELTKINSYANNNSLKKYNIIENIEYEAKKGNYTFNLFNITTRDGNKPWNMLFNTPYSTIYSTQLYLMRKYPEDWRERFDYDFYKLHLSIEEQEGWTRFMNMAGSRMCKNVVATFKEYCDTNKIKLNIKDKCYSSDPHAYVYWGKP